MMVHKMLRNSLMMENNTESSTKEVHNYVKQQTH